MKRTVLFFRDYRRFHGGHLKVFDYFNHVLASDGFEARIAFGPKTRWDETNPWIGSERYIVEDWKATPADAFFVGGRGWQMMEEHPDAAKDRPVINFAASLRHADPSSNRFEFLERKAIRICASNPVAESIRTTGLAKGPVIAIPNGVDVEALGALPERRREVDVLVAALKQPALGAELAAALAERGHEVELLSEIEPREEYLGHVRRARVALFLPLETEGFYLPALEAMALETLVVCPDCVGNRSFCVAEKTCLMPAYTAPELLVATERALALDPAQAAALLAEARGAAAAHSLAAERRSFLAVLARIDELWAE